VRECQTPLIHRPRKTGGYFLLGERPQRVAKRRSAKGRCPARSGRRWADPSDAKADAFALRGLPLNCRHGQGNLSHSTTGALKSLRYQAARFALGRLEADEMKVTVDTLIDRAIKEEAERWLTANAT